MNSARVLLLAVAICAAVACVAEAVCTPSKEYLSFPMPSCKVCTCDNGYQTCHYMHPSTCLGKPVCRNMLQYNTNGPEPTCKECTCDNGVESCSFVNVDVCSAISG